MNHLRSTNIPEWYNSLPDFIPLLEKHILKLIRWLIVYSVHLAHCCTVTKGRGCEPWRMVSGRRVLQKGSWKLVLWGELILGQKIYKIHANKGSSNIMKNLLPWRSCARNFKVFLNPNILTWTSFFPVSEVSSRMLALIVSYFFMVTYVNPLYIANNRAIRRWNSL